ncbi:ATPase [Desulfocarbo indianensis]|nr:ATPase [Desulfocarbo indianensis]
MSGGVSGFIIVLLFIAVVLLYVKRRKTKEELNKAKQQLEQAQQVLAQWQEAHGQLQQLLEESKQDLEQLRQETNPLRKYQKIVDADAEAEKVLLRAQEQAAEILDKAKAKLSDAGETATGIRDRAKEVLEEAVRQAKAELSEARQKAKEIRDRAQQTLDESAAQSNQIIESAKARAEEVAGDALKAKGKADQYESAARAMKNIIDGYGDEYIIPSRSILDELAEDFDHKQAGQELKKARQYVKTMIKNGLAAECDYVEANRKTYAIHFVLDAFNGKVDTALAKVRHDNYGKLRQEILDAFDLVNHNGAAFRNARIRKQYLEARLDELRWAVATYKLLVEEREEQRRIQQEMREEEKARREYEKAIREAEKEERLLQQAMEKARSELAAASDEERQQLEQKIADLQTKLEEAEAKEERAISMAQQTKRGHVYVISNIGSFGENVYKVGLTRRLEPEIRIRELGDASVPFPFDIHAMIFSEDSPALETELHRKFQDNQLNKVNPRKEFFSFGIKDIRQVVEEMGIEAHWTMAAEAQEYRESLALDKKARTIAQQEDEDETDPMQAKA